MNASVLSTSVVQGTTYPVAVTLYPDTKAPLDDLTAATVTIEPYRQTGTAAAGTWAWSTVTAAAAAGDSILGLIVPPTDGTGFPTKGEKVRVRVIVTLTGQEPFELLLLELLVQSRSGA